MVSAVEIASVVILAALVMTIVGAILVGKTGASSHTGNNAREIEPAAKGKRTSGIIVLVLGCVGILGCSIVIGTRGMKEYNRRFTNDRDIAEDQHGFGSRF